MHGSDKCRTFAPCSFFSWYYIFDYPEHLPERVGVFSLLCIKQLAKKCIFFENFCRNILQVWKIVVPLQHEKTSNNN